MVSRPFTLCGTRQGRGLGFSAQHLVEMPLFKGDPGVVRIPLEGASWRFGLCRLASHRPSDAERAFIGYCLESVGARPGAAPRPGGRGEGGAPRHAAAPFRAIGAVRGAPRPAGTGRPGSAPCSLV